jgi:regulatory protein
MRVTAIAPVPRRPDRLEIVLDGDRRLSLAAEVADRAGLRLDAVVSEADLERAEAEDRLWRARQDAFAFLAYRARSTAELRRRLAVRGHDPATAQRVLEDLLRSGYLDDDAFGQAFARDRLRSRPRAPRLIERELRARGLAPDTAGDAVAEALLDHGRSELDLARDVVAAWVRRNPPPGGGDPDRALRRRRRLHGHLARRGFSGDLIRAVLEELPPGD